MKMFKSAVFLCLVLALFTTEVFSAGVSKDDAVNFAQQWLIEAPSRLQKQLSATVTDVVAYSNSNNETVCYVALLDPAGFVVLSADDLSEPVIAFTDTGTLNNLVIGDPGWDLIRTESPKRNEQAKSIATLEAANINGTEDSLPSHARKAKNKWAKYLSRASSTEGISQTRSGRSSRGTMNGKKAFSVEGFLPTTALEGGIASISDIRISPLLSSAWSQSTSKGQYCYNYYTTNHCVAGCVATAMAQLMRFYQYPAAGIGQKTYQIKYNGSWIDATTRGGDGNGGAYVWSDMPLVPTSEVYDTNKWAQIGALCYDAGVSVNMQYATSLSVTDTTLAARALTNDFLYPNAKYIVNYAVGGIASNILRRAINPNLAAHYPVILGIIGDPGGHAIVCDGFGYSSGTEYHHLNMGWGGTYDLWYNLPLIDAGANVFDTVYKVIYNVFTNGTGELIGGRVLDGNANAVSNALVSAIPTGGGATNTASTDAKGYYSIKVPSATSYNLTASYSGMQASLTNISVGTSGTSDSGNYWDADISFNNTFTFTAQAHSDSVTIEWSDPIDAGVSNSTIKLNWKLSSYPTNLTDGTELYSGTNTTFSHTNLTQNQAYYYRIWLSNDGSTFINPPTGTNLATATPKPLPVQIIFRNSETAGGNGAWSQARTVFFRDDDTGIMKTNDMPDAFWTWTQQIIEKSGRFLGSTNSVPGQSSLSAKQLLVLEQERLYTICFDSSGNPLFNNSVHSNMYSRLADFVATTNHASTNAASWEISSVIDVDGNGQDEVILTTTNTFGANGAWRQLQLLFFADNGTLRSSNQPAPQYYWRHQNIDGTGRFLGPTNTVPGQTNLNAQQLLASEQNNKIYTINFDDNGTILFNDAVHSNMYSTLADFVATTNHATTNPADWRINQILDVDGNGQDEIILTTTNTFGTGGGWRQLQLLFFADNGTIRNSSQPNPQYYWSLQTIEGTGDMNSSEDGDELLLREGNGADFWVIHFNDSGDVLWTGTSYTNSISYGTYFATNASSWSVQAIGDFAGDR